MAIKPQNKDGDYKMRVYLAVLAVFLLGAQAKAENLVTFATNTAVENATGAIRMAINYGTMTFVDRLDSIHVNTPGTSSKLEIWDWDGLDFTTTTAKNKIGTYDTTSKQDWQFPYGLRISTDVIFFNSAAQGGTPADITLVGRKVLGLLE